MGEHALVKVRPPATQNVYAETPIKIACIIWWKIKIISSLTPSLYFFCKELIIFLFLFDGFMGGIFLLENQLKVER